MNEISFESLSFPQAPRRAQRLPFVSEFNSAGTLEGLVRAEELAVSALEGNYYNGKVRKD